MKDEYIKNELDDAKEDFERSSYLGNPIEDPNAARAISYVTYYPISTRVQDTAAATAANYGYFFVADRAYQVISISERHKTPGSDGGAVTLQVEKLGAAVAKGAGNNMLATAFDLKATANTNQYGTLTTTKSYLTIRRGDALGLVTSGTLTAVADVCVTVILRAI